MNKILCAIDFSEASINAIEHAAGIAENCGGSLTLLHVYTEEDFNQLYEKDEDHVNRTFKENSIIVEERLKILQKEIIDAEHRHIHNVNYILEFGDFLQTVDEIIDQQYDLIVMGTRGISHHQGFILGSNTLEIISRKQISVLAVPQTSVYHPYSYIVYASDLHERDRTGLLKLMPLANCFDARIQVVHFTSKSVEKSKDSFSSFTEELRSFINYDKISFDLKHYEEELNLTMEEYIREKKGYLLALLDKKPSFFESLFHESLIKRMTYISDTPLLVLKS